MNERKRQLSFEGSFSNKDSVGKESNSTSEGNPKKVPELPKDIYSSYKIGPLIEEVLLANSERFRESKSSNRPETEKIASKVYGEGIEVPRRMSVSTAANCLRWVGYEQLGEKPVPRTFKQEMGMLVGSATHGYLLRKLYQFGWQEQSVFIDDPGISGRLDFLMRNLKTGEYQVMDLKVTGEYGFRQIKRAGLPDFLKGTKGIYWPGEEARLQLLQYLYAVDKQGKNVVCGNVIYLNRNDFSMKECIVPWDEIARYDAEEFLEKAKEARKKIDNGELPEPSVLSEYVCGSFCGYRDRCEYGQKFAAGAIKRQRKRRPNWVYKKAKEESEKKKEMMIQAGVIQPELDLVVNIDQDSQQDKTTQKLIEQEEKLYILGEYVEVDKPCWGGCGSNLREIFMLEKELSRGKSRIIREVSCAHCGNPETGKLTVKNSQLIKKES